MFQFKSKILGVLENKTHQSPLKQIRIRPVGYACTHACPMCWREHLTPALRKQLSLAAGTDLTAEEYVSMITSLPSTVKRIVISGGGEPLLFNKITPLIRVIKETGREGYLITNGTNLTGSVIDMFVQAGWNDIGISFNAASKKIYTLVNGADTYDKVIRNIKDTFRKRGFRQFPRIQLTFVIQKDNYMEIVAFVKMCIAMHIDGINFSPLSPHDLTLLNTVSNLALNTKERLATLEFLHRAKTITQTTPRLQTNIDTMITTYETHPSFNEAASKQSYWGIKYCDVIENNMDIAADGDVKPCCYGWQINSGFNFNVRRQSVADIWNSKQYQRFRENLHAGKFLSQCSKYCTFLLPKKH